jgi:hypothetical protein
MRHFIATNLSYDKTIMRVQNGALYHHHYNARKWIQNLKVIDVNFFDLFSFTIIRNPWDRVISAFNYQQCDVDGVPFYGKGYNKSKGLIPWDKWIFVIPHIPSLDKFAFNGQGKQLVTKIYKLEDFDLKQLENDMNTFMNNTKIKNEIKNVKFNNYELQKLNVTFEKKIYKNKFTKEQIEFVKNKFKKDIEVGGYVFTDDHLCIP